MEAKEIQQKRKDIAQRLKEHDATTKQKRKEIEAELLVIQHLCTHENSRYESDNHPKSSSTWWECKDCGKIRDWL